VFGPDVFFTVTPMCCMQANLLALIPCSIDADPDAVAKYTVALVRKGPDTEEEFKPSICENLSVFLTESKILYLVSGLV